MLRARASEGDYIHSYPAETWGPDEGMRLFDQEHQGWRNAIEEDLVGSE